MSCFDLWDMCSLNHTYNEQFLYVCIPYIVIYIHIMTYSIMTYNIEKGELATSVEEKNVKTKFIYLDNAGTDKLLH